MPRKPISSLTIACTMDVAIGDAIKDAKFAVIREGEYAGRYLPVNATDRAVFLALEHAKHLLMRQTEK